jgi:hypothetical protein
MFDKHRFEVWTPAQHPLKHTLSDFAYSNNAAPGVTDVNSALNWLYKVLYPNNKAAVATPGDLPSTGNTLNDYRVVLNDGDGNQAGYRWEQREGDVSPLWYKVFDFDWSTDSILAAFTDITQDLYVYQQGKSDLDSSGAPIAGIYAGQKIYGGNLSTQNLTLAANNGDGVGAHTGFVQVDDHFRATVTDTYDLGTSSIKFRTAYLETSAEISTLSLSSGSISDSNGDITFGISNLSTSGSLTAGVITGATFVSGTMIISAGYISDSSGTISFGGTIISTTGNISATGSGNVLSNFTFSPGSLTSASATINFGSNNILTTGSITGGAISGTSFSIGNLSFSGNTIRITNTNGNLILQANGTGVIDLQNSLTTLGQVVTGVMSITGQLNADNLRLDGNVISSTDLNGNITLTPNGAGVVETSSILQPAASATIDLGAAAKRFKDIYLSGGVSDGTTSIAQSVLQSLRDINVSVSSGMSLFWNGSKWVPSIPDTEIVHNTLSGLTTGDAGHTQFVALAGRSGGQIVQGGTASSEHLTFESTSNATKGKIKAKDSFVAFAAPVYSSGWTGVDLGASAAEFNDIYTKGELKGGRFQNVTSGALPSASGQNVGRVVWATDNNKLYVDIGGTWQQVGGAGKYLSDTSWSGVQLTQTFTVSSSITDARNAIWAIHDNTNDFERIFCTIKAISATQVTVTMTIAVPAGSYRLIGIE